MKYEQELTGLSAKVLAGQLLALRLPYFGIPKAGLIQRLVAHRFPIAGCTPASIPVSNYLDAARPCGTPFSSDHELYTGYPAQHYPTQNRPANGAAETCLIRFLRQSDTVVFSVSMKRTTKFKRAFELYSCREGVLISDCRFIWFTTADCDRHIVSDDTPETLGMANEEEIFVMLTVRGC